MTISHYNKKFGLNYHIIKWYCSSQTIDIIKIRHSSQKKKKKKSSQFWELKNSALTSQLPNNCFLIVTLSITIVLIIKKENIDVLEYLPLYIRLLNYKINSWHGHELHNWLCYFIWALNIVWYKESQQQLLNETSSRRQTTILTCFLLILKVTCFLLLFFYRIILQRPF